MDQREKLRVAVISDQQLIESNLKLIEEFLIDNKTPELLSTLCDMISQIDGQWYALYKITVIIKYLCARSPKELASLLRKRKEMLESLKNFTHVDHFERDQGANVRNNVEQLLNFIEDENKFEDRTEDPLSIWTIESGLNSAIDRLFRTLDSIDSPNSERILQKLRFDIARLSKYLPCVLTFEKYTELDRNPEINGTIYGQLVERIIEIFDDNFPMNGEKIDPTIENFFVVQGSTFLMFHESLVVLTDALKNSTNKRVTNSLIIILEKLIKSDSLVSAIMEACRIAKKSSAIEREEMMSKWQSTLQIIVSLPSRIANKLDGKISNSFVPEIYAKIITIHIAKSVIFLNLCNEKFPIEPDPRILSMLIGKAIVTLGSQKFVTLIDAMSVVCSENSMNMKNLIKKILFNIERAAMEPVAILFLKRCDPTHGIGGIFENFLDNPNWRRVFAMKIPLMSYHENENLTINLIAYLANSSSKDERILPNLVARLLDIWGDRSALNHTSFEQHVYVTKLIIMSVKRISRNLTKSEKDEMRRLLFSGISAHLESTQSELTGVGMITGQLIIEMLNDSTNEPLLTYDYEGMPPRTREIVEKLRNLGNNDEKSKNPPEELKKSLYNVKISFENPLERKIYELSIECGILSREASDFSSIIDETRNANEISVSQKCDSHVSPQDSDENLDSDDDLVPYDMSNDTPIIENLRPRYLRDLRDNLLNSQSNSDPNIFAEAMRASEELIKSQLPSDDSSFGLELLEILVTLREISYLENFELYKRNACVSIVLVFPCETAKYLCQEFHAKIGEYSIKDRLFILDILAESSRRLSKISIETSRNDGKTKSTSGGGKRGGRNLKKISLAMDARDVKRHETLYDDDFEVLTNFHESTNDWHEIIAKRIESNTRRFAHTTKLASTTMNKFNDAAASFFYPLLYGFRREGTCMQATPTKTFEDQENILLINYLRTLSTIMIAAENCIIVPKIGKEIMNLAWSLRYHSQARVRSCVIENIASVVITMPREGLDGELMELIFEFRAWLADVSDDGIRGDPDSECRKLGKNVISLIDSTFRSTLNEF